MQALVTFDDSWDEEAIVNAFMDNDQLPGVLVVKVVPSCGGKCAAEESGRCANTSTNTAMPKCLSCRWRDTCPINKSEIVAVECPWYHEALRQ